MIDRGRLAKLVSAAHAVDSVRKSLVEDGFPATAERLREALSGIDHALHAIKSDLEANDPAFKK